MVDLTGKDDESAYKVTQVSGHRDGDLAEAEVHFSDGSATLTVHMRFAVGAPTRLESGWWRWPRPGHMSGGNVVARSVMFLGGQNGPPSIGGSYDLLDTNGADRYRIYIPTTELETRVPTVR